MLRLGRAHSVKWRLTRMARYQSSKFPQNGVLGNYDPIQSELAQKVTLRTPRDYFRFARDSLGTPEYACSALDSSLGELQIIYPEQLVRPSILRIERTRLCCRLRSVGNTFRLPQTMCFHLHRDHPDKLEWKRGDDSQITGRTSTGKNRRQQ